MWHVSLDIKVQVKYSIVIQEDFIEEASHPVDIGASQRYLIKRLHSFHPPLPTLPDRRILNNPEEMHKLRLTGMLALCEQKDRSTRAREMFDYLLFDSIDPPII